MLQARTQAAASAVGEFERSVLRHASNLSGYRLFALLDLAPHEGLLPNLTRIEAGLQWKSLFDGTPEEALLEAAPILVEMPLDFESRPLVRELVKAERAAPSVSWLRTGLSFRDLFIHLQPFLDADLPDGRKALFRFYDPRTLFSIRSGLGADKFGRSLFEPISAWWLWRTGGYQDLLEGYRYA